MKRYMFVVAGNPLPKERPRVVNGHAYTPGRTRVWEQVVRLAYRGPCFRGPLAVTMWFYRENNRRVDTDNIGKAVQDALNGHAWADDAQIVELHLYRAVDRRKPRVEVEIKEVLHD